MSDHEDDSDEWSVDEPRLMLVDWAQRQVGCLYKWGGKGELGEDGTPRYDCSGLVTCGLLYVRQPDWRQTHSAARLFDELKPTEKPAPMDLVFYGQPGHISHVVFHWSDGRILGACGGNQSTTTAEAARKAGACVKFKATQNYRPDFRGWRSLPFT